MRVLKYVLTFRWANVLSEIAGYLSAVALILATVFMTYGVSLRYFFGKPTVWQTEVSIYLLVFVTFVGAAYGLKHHAHVGVDLLVERLPLRPQLFVRVTTAVLALGVAAVASGRPTGPGGRPSRAVSTPPPCWRLRSPWSTRSCPSGCSSSSSSTSPSSSRASRACWATRTPSPRAAILGQGNAELAAAVEQKDTSAADVGAAGSVATTPNHAHRRKAPAVSSADHGVHHRRDGHRLVHDRYADRLRARADRDHLRSCCSSTPRSSSSSASSSTTPPTTSGCSRSRCSCSWATCSAARRRASSCSRPARPGSARSAAGWE